MKKIQAGKIEVKPVASMPAGHSMAGKRTGCK
jgi:hypothetical protein